MCPFWCLGSQVIACSCGPIGFVTEWAKRFRPLWIYLNGQMWMWVGTSSWQWGAKGMFWDLFHCRCNVQLGFCVYRPFSWYLNTFHGVRSFSWIKLCVRCRNAERELWVPLLSLKCLRSFVCAVSGISVRAAEMGVVGLACLRFSASIC